LPLQCSPYEAVRLGMMRLGLIATAKEVRSLSRLRGGMGWGLPRIKLPVWREPPPGAQRRPPPQAGEVKRVCGQTDLTKVILL
jgi:hypothetical protein